MQDTALAFVGNVILTRKRQPPPATMA